MKLFLRRNAPLFYALGAMLALYIPWLNRGYVNLEFPFVLAGRALAFHADVELIGGYWGTIANPLGYSIVLSFLFRVFGVHEFWLSRLPAVLGAALILASIWVLTREMWAARRPYFLLSILLLLNPMVFVFSTTGTADILPVGLLLLSIAIAFHFRDRNYGWTFLSALIFGISIVIKYNGLYFGLALVAAVLKANSNTIRSRTFFKVISLFIVPGIILGSYVLWSERRFDVFISSRLAFSAPNFFNVEAYLINISKYLSYLGLFCGPLPLFALVVKHKRDFLPRVFWFCVVFLLYLILISPRQAGELDLGLGFPLSKFSGQILESIGFLNGIILIYLLSGSLKSNLRLKLVFICGLAPYAILAPFTYPSQRYLLFVLPFILVISVDALQGWSIKLQQIAVGLTASVFAAVSLLGMSYLTSQGNASEDMAVWVEENNLISQTSAGAIWPHAGQHFWGVKTAEIRYEIVAFSPATESQVQERILHREPMKVLGKVTRVYLLREIPATP